MGTSCKARGSPFGHVFPHVSNWDTKNSMSHRGKPASGNVAPGRVGLQYFSKVVVHEVQRTVHVFGHVFGQFPIVKSVPTIGPRLTTVDDSLNDYAECLGHELVVCHPDASSLRNDVVAIEEKSPTPRSRYDRVSECTMIFPMPQFLSRQVVVVCVQPLKDVKYDGVRDIQQLFNWNQIFQESLLGFSIQVGITFAIEFAEFVVVVVVYPQGNRYWRMIGLPSVFVVRPLPRENFASSLRSF